MRKVKLSQRKKAKSAVSKRHANRKKSWAVSLFSFIDSCVKGTRQQEIFAFLLFCNQVDFDL